MSEPTAIGRCWICARDLTAADYGREQTCPGCGKPTRVCRNCRHYAPGRPNDCVEPIAERVLDKTRANFCELFEPELTPRRDPARPEDDSLLKAAESLFK